MMSYPVDCEPFNKCKSFVFSFYVKEKLRNFVGFTPIR